MVARNMLGLRLVPKPSLIQRLLFMIAKMISNNAADYDRLVVKFDARFDSLTRR